MFTRLFSALLSIALPILFTACSQQEASHSYRTLAATVQQENTVPIPDGNRVAFGWEAAGLDGSNTAHLSFSQKLDASQHHWLRLSVAQEGWDAKRIRATIPQASVDLGAFDIRYSAVLVPYEIKVPQEHLSLIEQHGITLELEEGSPFWFYQKTTPGSEKLEPHLLSSKSEYGEMADLIDTITSANSIQSFGWREGTVLDGLWQLHTKAGHKDALDAIHQHFDLYFNEASELIYETARSQPHDNQISGIESTIPFATLAHVEPNHPFLKKVVAGWEELKKENGMVIDGTMISAEGCYTVAYPMAAVGKAWNDEALMAEAQEQLKHRFVLIEDGNLYLRHYTEGRYTFRNWARGAAWTLLGFSRTIEELGVDNVDREIIEKFQEAIDNARAMQRPDGLWSCFMHDPENSLPDTSGSAGISAAILTGIDLGILPDSYRTSAEKAYAALQSYIAPDGFLQGVAQDNRGGRELQESDYRVIAQMGMGMVAQLHAAMEKAQR